jgi:soluble lytic murein transglycosylase
LHTIVAVYGRTLARLAVLGATSLCAVAVGATPLRPLPPGSPDAVIVDAREALKKKDKPRLAALRAQAIAAGHPLAMWADYFDLSNRLTEAQQADLDAFYERWRGTYVEDRLRNDWLLELGKRRDWANFATDHPRFRMNDDREVACYALLIDHQNGKPVREAALAAWYAQREADDGCIQLAATLLDAKEISVSDVWRKARLAVDMNRPRVARQALALFSTAIASSFTEAWDNPARFLAQRSSDAPGRSTSELATLALLRWAQSDPNAAAAQLDGRWDKLLPPDLATWAWAGVGKQAAIALLPEAPDYFQRAQLRAAKDRQEAAWPDDTLAWKVRAALRADNGRGRWQQVMQAISSMSEAEQAEPAWSYWKARALLALAKDSQDGDAMRALADEALQRIAGRMDFYGKLAAEQLGVPVVLPPRPEPITDDEREAALRHPGLARALRLIAIGLRSEGVREWNFSLRGMNDRELLAAAQLACDREVWDRCINTSDRTRSVVDMAQRFPMPFRREVMAHARELGLEPAYVYGLIRQESRFVMDARSGVGASGLMQLMPATARWTARKIGLEFSPSMINERDVNLRLGTSYLKLIFDEFASPALAAAAYNAGPTRSRKWREGPPLDVAVWAENIPFNETRDYVKKVLSNTAWYAALLHGKPVQLTPQLGGLIGPRADSTPPPTKDLP